MFALNFLELATFPSDDETSFGEEIASHRKFLTGSHSGPLFPRLQVTNVIEGIVGAGAEFLQEFWIGQDIYGGLFHLLRVV